MVLKGRLFDGQSSTSHTAILNVDENGEISADPDILSATKFTDISISSRVGNTPRTLTFPSGEIFETVDHDKLDAIIKQQGGKESWVHKLESNTRHVVAALLFLVAFITWSVVWGLPWLSVQVAYALPAEANNYIGQGTLETLDDRVFEESTLDPLRKEELTRSFTELLPKENQDFTYRLVFRGGGFIGANAFALPDGTIVITDELVELAENDNEIISVLLHEIGHVEHRHSLRGILSHAGLTALVLTITGDVSSASSLVVALPNVLLQSSYSRDLEWEADTYSLEYMRAHNMRFEDFANFMERLDAQAFVEDDDYENSLDDLDDLDRDQQVTTDSNTDIQSDKSEKTSIDLGWLNYISSHPPSKERAERFRKGEAFDYIE